MNNNIIETRYDVTKKSKLKEFYDLYKIYIFLTIVTLVISAISYAIISEIKDNKKVDLSNKYISAKIFLDNKENRKAKEVLSNIIYENDSTYSTLSLFLLIDQNLINDKKEILDLFEYLLINCKFEDELKNLIIFKKAMHQSSYVDEGSLLKTLNPIISKENFWKPHALLLLGNYYLEKKEKNKAKEFFQSIMLLKNLNNQFYKKAKSQLVLLENE